MASEDSDDEPLALLAASKKRDEYELKFLPNTGPGDALTKLKIVKKECDVSVALQVQSLTEHETPVVERPADVWMYLTDFKTSGPYSCLLCSEWFINRTRIVIHYVVNHKKDYCGICRYFVPNRDAWWEHLKFHVPWKCSQCEDAFSSHTELKEHFSSVHKLVHCRMCYLRVSDDEQYHTHLYKKHCITNLEHVNREVLWDFEYEGSQKFLCLLCSKSWNVGRQFGDHFMAYHHLNLKCLMFLICGVDLPFSVKGIELTTDFKDTYLKDYSTLGYVDLVKTLKVKEEPVTDIYEIPITVDCKPELQETDLDEHDADTIKLSEELKGYRGTEDFDVTLVELIVMEQCYFEYIQGALKEINSNAMPYSSVICYEDPEKDLNTFNCCLCTDIFEEQNAFETHMTKVHCLKSLPLYWCRVCAAVFETQLELDVHSRQELKEFDDLWICQFCDKEFDGREETRKHLTEHWSEIEYDNCFSPHLGFKCKFCPTLFWNEPDRETHHVRVHIPKHKSDFYKCTSCGETFGDKVFFIHHYLHKHNGKNPTYLLKCCICSVVLQNVQDMRSHFEATHPDARKIFCSKDLCKYKPLSQRKSFLMHLKTIHDPSSRPSRPVTCATCGMEFTSRRARSLHIVRAHGPGRFKCTLCNVMLHTGDERIIHYLISHPGRFQYQCDSCDKSFQYKSSLYMHKQEHLPNKKDYTCSYCGKAFMKRDSYREHILIHEAPRHACSYCPMRFVQRSNMLRHERRHTGERPYSCKLCPRTFSDKGACTSHLRTHLQNSSFACVYCGQTFAQKSKLTYHIRRHTGENLETCSLCSKIFTSACSLREHMKVHQRQKMKKTVKCPLCKNMYSDEKEMMRHMRAAHTGARYKCPLCRKTVCSPGSLRDHVLTHSAVNTYQCKMCPKTYHAKKSMIKHLQIRHGLQTQEISPQSSYGQLDPKECQLGLADDVIERIFTNLKKKRNTDILLADFVTFNRNIPLATQTRETKEPDSSDSPSEEDTSVREDIVTVKLEPQCEDEDEYHPPNFVNVKIECVEEPPDSDAEA